MSLKAENEQDMNRKLEKKRYIYELDEPIVEELEATETEKWQKMIQLC